MKPNILMIVIDQFRADLLHGRLAEVADLRHLRALEAECISFRQHYSVVAPCGPSRVSLFTGQYAMNHRAVRNGTPLRHDTPNLARAARDAGYEPLLFGYTDTTQDPRALPDDDPRLRSYEELMPGFTEIVQMRQESGDEAWRDHLRAKGHDVPDGMALYRPDGDTIDAPAIYAAGDSDTAYLTDRFLSEMEKREAGWFAALTYIRPHPPFVAPAPYNRAVSPADIPPALTGGADDPFSNHLREVKPARTMVEGFPYLPNDGATVQTLRAIYLGLAREVDDHIGRVVAWLKETGRWDETIVVVTSDHGEMLGDFGLWGKGSYHDACYHVPLMIRAPGEAPRAVETMSESVDVAPTVLDLIGGDIPDSMDGVSLRPVIEGRTDTHKSVTFSEQDFGHPIRPTVFQERLSLTADEANMAILRTPEHRFVQFAKGLEPLVFQASAEAPMGVPIDESENLRIFLDLSQKMLCHRMVHPEGTFAGTMIVGNGVERRSGR